MICASKFGINRTTGVSGSHDMYHKSARSNFSSARTSFAACFALFAFTPVMAGETVLYSYDALGRLVRTQQTGTVNNGVNTDIDYDAAGNRTDYDVTGSNGSGTDGGVTGTPGSGGGSGGGGETPPTFAINDATAIEGGSLTFTVTKNGTVTNSYSVSYATANGSALAGPDYTAKSGTLTFTGAEASKTIVVASVNDSVSEQTEAFYVDLSAPTGGSSVTDPQGAGTISDNDVPANSPPVATDDVMLAFCGNGSSNVLLNDTDADGDVLTVTSVTGGMGATIQNNIVVATLAIDGTLTYTVQDIHGATDTGAIQVWNSCGPL